MAGAARGSKFSAISERQEEQAVESRELMGLSEALAAAVESAAAKVVMVDSRRRRAASGIVYGEDLVLVADHALEREEDITLGTPDGRKLPAEVVGRNPAADLALLRAGELGLEAARPSEEPARIGQLALAIGRPASDGVRARLGIISATGESLRTGRGRRLERYLGADTAPFPGLSGGPLVDASGAVLGVVVAGFRGVSIAVPAGVAWRVASGLAAGEGAAGRGYLGILSQPVYLPELRQRGGLLVVGVEEGSTAARSGLVVGDILLTFDGSPLRDTDDLQGLMFGRAGSEASVELLRGGERQTVRVAIGERG
jgi:serine protease DegQ